MSLEGLREPCSRESLEHESPPRFLESCAQRPIEEQARDAVRQRIGIAGRDEQRMLAIFEDLGDDADP